MTNQNDTKQCKYGCKGNGISPMYGCPIHGEQVASKEKCDCDDRKYVCKKHFDEAHRTPPPATEGEEERKMPKKYELDLIFLINKLLDEYNKARISAPYKGKYPSPFEKAQNDISDLFTKTLHAQAEEIFKDLEADGGSYTNEEVKSKYLTKE